jgi:WD40 repeat protein
MGNVWLQQGRMVQFSSGNHHNSNSSDCADGSDNEIPILSADISPNGKFLVTLADGIAKLWNWSGELQQEVKIEQGSIRSLSFSPDSQYLATAALDGTIRIWNWSEKHLERFNSYQKQPGYVGFSPDGERIATVGLEGQVRLWDLSGRQLAQFGSDKKQVRTISFSPDGKQLAAVDSSNVLSLYRVIKLNELLQEGCDILRSSRGISLGISRVSRCKYK